MLPAELPAGVEGEGGGAGSSKKLHERLSTLLTAHPDDASITVTTETIRGWLQETEGDSSPSDAPAVEADEDHLLTVDGVAEVLAVERTWVYRHADELPFTRKLSAGTLRFSSNGLQRWLASRR